MVATGFQSPAAKDRRSISSGRVRSGCTESKHVVFGILQWVGDGQRCIDIGVLSAEPVSGWEGSWVLGRACAGAPAFAGQLLPPGRPCVTRRTRRASRPQWRLELESFEDPGTEINAADCLR
jgi:hypothetical protein